MKANSLDRRGLISKLERITAPAPDGDDDDAVEHMSLAVGLLAIAEIDHEREFKASRDVATHLLGALYEPQEWARQEEDQS